MTSPTVALEDDRSRTRAKPDAVLLIVPGAFAALLVIVLLLVFDVVLGLAALAALVIFALVVDSPGRAGVAFLLLTPLLAGFERGAMIPVMRPSEALLGLLLAAILARALADGLDGRLPAYRVTGIDRAILGLAVLSSGVPLLWRYGRGFALTVDDVLFAATLWKYFLVFALFRLVVQTEEQVKHCLQAMLGVGVIVALVALVQALSIGSAPQLISDIYGLPLDTIDNNRGSSTLGTSHGVADIMAFDLGICAAFLMKGLGDRRVLGAAAVLFGLATLASGQFSALFAIVVAVVIIGGFRGQMLRTVGVAVPAMAGSLVLLRPVIDARLASTNESGVPSSWDARRFNLENYFWPELFDGTNWLLGVRPAGRLPSFEPWREWVYIESGHTWLLWTGGVPFLLAFLWFSWLVGRRAHSLASAPGVTGALGVSLVVAFWVVFILMAFDVHLTMRGPADAFFPLVALSTVPALKTARSPS
ncbi:MAG: hypothetical protein GY925_06935 [Actinomycetia bacterium]|nr:hypothetical protein [Actinomycetes bacterium]